MIHRLHDQVIDCIVGTTKAEVTKCYVYHILTACMCTEPVSHNIYCSYTIKAVVCMVLQSICGMLL